MEQWLAKINKLEAWQVACIIAVVGLTVFFTGLHNPFMGDDDRQIVSNIPVHSIANIRLFFEGSTFYNSQGLTPLSGSYYRPLMTTVFSLLYTLFGPHPVYFHPFQLILYIGGAILLYLFLQKSFGSILSLALSLVFLVHPVNSQAVFAIPSMQEGLFFFFGMLAIWSLVRFRSVRSLLFVALCLFLSLLSKEIGVLFVVMSALYLFWFDRKRLLAYLSVMVLPIIFYLLLKIHAVGLFAGPNQNIAPIASLSLGGRLLTAPAIVLFYITKFIFP